MTKSTRNRYSAEFKSKVALEAIRGELTLSQLGAKYGVHQTMINSWKKQAIDKLSTVFEQKFDFGKTPDAMTFTTAVFGRSSSWRFGASSYKAAPKSPPSSFVQHDADCTRVFMTHAIFCRELMQQSFFCPRAT